MSDSDDIALKERLLAVADGLERPPTEDEFEYITEESTKPYLMKWGSWTEAKRAVGIGPCLPYGAKASEDNLLTEIDKVSHKIGRTPRQNDMVRHGKFTVARYKSVFGTWNEALEVAGYEPNQQKDISGDELLVELDRLAEELGKPPTTYEAQELGKYSQRPYYRVFGSWTEALEAAGLEPNKERNIGDDDLLDEIRRLADELGESPISNDMIEFGKYSLHPYKRAFGSWTDALEEAGFEKNSGVRGKKLDDDDLLEDIRRLSDELGRTPRVDDIQKHGNYSRNVYYDRFGSWNDAVEAAGFEPNEHPDKIPREDLLDDIRRIGDELDKKPSRADMRRHGKHSVTTYSRRFDSWTEAKERALNHDDTRDKGVLADWS